MATDFKLKAPAPQKVKYVQILFILFFSLLQAGLFYETNYSAQLTIIGFFGGFFFGLYIIVLRYKKKKYENLMFQQLIEKEKNNQSV